MPPIEAMTASPTCWSYSRRQVSLWDGVSLVHRRSKDPFLGPEGGRRDARHLSLVAQTAQAAGDRRWSIPKFDDGGLAPSKSPLPQMLIAGSGS